MSRMPTTEANREDVNQPAAADRKFVGTDQPARNKNNSNSAGPEITLPSGACREATTLVVVPSFEIEGDDGQLDVSEGRIVLRKTNSGAKLSAPSSSRRKSAAAAISTSGNNNNSGSSSTASSTATATVNNSSKALSALSASGVGSTSPTFDYSAADEDARSVTTTTSDVNSDDDAASIVSRLSQIVVEQEEKLLSSHDDEQQSQSQSQSQHQQLQRPGTPFGTVRRLSVSPLAHATSMPDSSSSATLSKSKSNSSSHGATSNPSNDNDNNNMSLPHMSRVRSSSNVLGCQQQQQLHQSQQVGRADLAASTAAAACANLQQQQQQQGRRKGSLRADTAKGASTSSASASSALVPRPEQPSSSSSSGRELGHHHHHHHHHHHQQQQQQQQQKKKRKQHLRQPLQELLPPSSLATNASGNGAGSQIKQQHQQSAEGNATPTPSSSLQTLSEFGAGRARTKSVVELKPAEWQPSFMRRNESSGFLPERGDLRALESSRQQAAAAAAASNYHQKRHGSTDIGSKNQLFLQQHSQLGRPRSSTTGDLDGSVGGGLSQQQAQSMSTNNNEGSLSSTTSSSGLMLNIKRSAWTLPEFDQTFNKSVDEFAAESSSSSQSDRELIRTLSSESDQQQQALTRAPLQERPSNNSLLIRASMNATQYQQQQQELGQQQQQQPSSAYLSVAHAMNNNPVGNAAAGGGGAPGGRRCSSAARGATNDFNYRRPSQSYSIVSFASSMDSIYSGFTKKSFTRRRANSARNAYGRTKKKGGGGGRSAAGGASATGHGAADSGTEGEDGGELSCCKTYCNLATLGQYLPILEWLPAYQFQTYLWGDMMAGMAVAVLNISTSLSAAVVAETSLGAAFRASIVSTFVYALLCSSRHTSFGSWSIMSQMLVVSVRRALNDELILDRLNLGPTASWKPEEYEKWHLNIIIMYTFLIGLVQLVCGLLNLGNILSSFIPEALCSSMIAATAFTMAIGQLANMCGTSNKILFALEKNTTELLVADLKTSDAAHITDVFAGLFRWIRQISLLIKHSDQINMVCVVISVASVILLCLNQYVIQKQLERLLKRKILIPFEMILLIAMIIISYSLDLSEKFKVPACGPIHIDFVIPNIPNLGLIRELWFESLATALISYTMVYIMAKTYGNKLNYDVDCNQELIACGAGNLIGGLVDALPATASFSRTASQVEAGGQTQMASIINCIILVVLARLLGHHVAVLPVCVMAATLFYGFARMMTRFTEVFIYWRVCKVDLAIWLVTFTAIITLDLVNGFVYGFIFSIITMLYRAQNRRCYMLGCIENSDVYVPLVKYPVAHEIEGMKIFQFCGPIHYACADLFERLLRQKTRVNVKLILRHIQEQEVEKFNPRDMNLPTHIILDFSMISFIDSAGIHVIKKIIEDYQRVNITIMLASLAFHVATVVKSEPSLWSVYKERFYVTLADAVHCAMRDRSFGGNGPPTICTVSINAATTNDQQQQSKALETRPSND